MPKRVRPLLAMLTCLLACSVLTLVTLATARQAHAICNLIPGTIQSFRARLGTVDRPFASPGDFVGIRLSPACDTSSTGFAATAAGHVVTLVFTPPNNGPRNTVVLASNCAHPSIGVPACTTGAAYGTTASCCLPGTFELGTLPGLGGQTQLRFRFPDTDALFADPNSVGTIDDNHTLSGPLTIAVSRLGDPLPLGLATGGQSCQTQSGLVACVDDLFVVDGHCTPSAAHETFSHFTALPPQNRYQALCTTPAPPCTGTASELLLTLDAAGNLLIPMDWRGVLVGNGVPIARFLRGRTTVPAFEMGTEPMSLPDSSFLHSYSPEGGLVPPLFDPQARTDAPADLTLFGTADAPRGVLRIARRGDTYTTCVAGGRAGLPCASNDQCPGSSCDASHCVGGTHAGQTCGSDLDCPQGECGGGLFDFAGRLEESVGPLVIPQNLYEATVKDSVPLDALLTTQELLVSVLPEGLQGHDLNGDGDTTDNVLLLTDRKTGEQKPIGTAMALGRAATRIQQPPFSYPAIVAAGPVVAFLEYEPGQGGIDSNANNDVFDTILRVFQLQNGSAEEMTAGLDLATDAAPVIDGKSLAISGDHLFFRASEARRARQLTQRVSVTAGGVQGNGFSQGPALSGDGHLVTFFTQARNFLTVDANSFDLDIFQADLNTGALTLVNLSTTNQQANDSCSSVATSSDGTLVAFSTSATNLIGGKDTNGLADIYVRDLMSNSTERVSIDTDGNEADDAVQFPAIAANGRFVAFGSRATNLAPGDEDTPGTFGSYDVFLHDRLKHTTERISVNSAGVDGDNASLRPSVSADGRLVAFDSIASNLVEGATRGIFLRDRVNQTTEIVSVDSFGTPGNFSGFSPVLSADGRFVAFNNQATNLVPGDTNGLVDIFVHDRATGQTTRASVDSNGAQGGGTTSSFAKPAISADGRYVGFASPLTGLVPNITSNQLEAYVHDNLTGATRLVSVRETGGGPGNAASSNVVLSANGSVVAFHSDATDLVPGDTNGSSDVFVRTADPTDTGADLTQDGDFQDTVLQAIRTEDGTLLGPACPAEQVATSGGVAVFLRPEAAGNAPGCPVGQADTGGEGVDLNGDGDAEDQVIHVWREDDGVTVDNLQRAATHVAISDGRIAALVEEAAQGGVDLNGDGDAEDTVLQTTSIFGEPWSNTARAAESLSLHPGYVAFLVPEAPQNADLNGDGDFKDSVVHLYRFATQTVINIGQAAEELVASDTLIAMRTNEVAQRSDLNGDGANDDFVLQIFDPQAEQLINTGQTVTPCLQTACDPRQPYRVLRDTVKFLTFEPDQGADLNGDGDNSDLVLQTFNVRRAQSNSGMSSGLAGDRSSALLVSALGSGGAAPVAAVSTGICTNTGAACGSDANCGSGRCFVPPGSCVKDLGTSCTETCPSGQICIGTATDPTITRCHLALGACRADMECKALDAAAQCVDAAQQIQRLTEPLAKDLGGAQVFAGAGRCLDGTEQDLGVCRKDSDCPTGTTCHADVVVATAPDSDGDEIADPFDNCPSVPNVTQEASTASGVGDVCAMPAAAHFSLTTTAARPGGIACLQGALAGGTNAVGDVRSEVAFEGDYLSFVDCTKGATVSQSLSRTHLNADEERLDVGPCEGDAVSDGVLYNCRIAVADTTPLGDQALTSSPRLSNRQCREVPNVAGAVAQVVVSTCSGDCDGRDGVSVGELVKCVNVFLGAPVCHPTDASKSCPIADTDGDGLVTIGETSQCVARFLGGC